MSGGEQQHVAVARALVIEPALVLADEPTGNLDSVNGAQVMRLLRDLVDSRGQTVVIVTHDNDVAAQADRTVHVRDGRLEEYPRVKCVVLTPRACELVHDAVLEIRLARLHQRPSRPILTLLSIVIGVAAVVAVTITSGTTRRAFDQIYKTVAGRASLELSASVGTLSIRRLATEIRSVPGVKAVAPLMERHTVMSFGKRNYKLVALGVDPAFDREVHDYEITAGKSLAEASGVLLEATFARNAGIKVGDLVDFLSREGYVIAQGL